MPGGVSVGAAERFGRMHWSITTSSSPGAPSQRMSPLRSSVPSGPIALSLTCTVREEPVSCTVTRPPSTTTRAWNGLTASRSRYSDESGEEPIVSVPLSGSSHSVPASGPPSTVSDDVLLSAITLPCGAVRREDGRRPGRSFYGRPRSPSRPG